MIRELPIHFDTGGVVDAPARVRAALGRLALVCEQVDEHEGRVVVVIYKPSWDAADPADVRRELEAEGLPGTFEAGHATEHGFRR